MFVLYRIVQPYYAHVLFAWNTRHKSTEERPLVLLSEVMLTESSKLLKNK